MRATLTGRLFGNATARDLASLARKLSVDGNPVGRLDGDMDALATLSGDFTATVELVG
jgi:hypothetical protein